MSGRAALVAAAPLAAALLALAAAAATGFSQASALPAAVETRFYGFFLDRYPLFAFALVYAAAHVVAAAAGLPGPASVPRRILGAILGLALAAALNLHPTFGGLVLRGGFIIGGMAFLHQVPLLPAYLLGAAVSAGTLWFATWLGTAIAAGRPPRRGPGLLRGVARILAGMAAGLLALWFALAVLGYARELGFGPWPRRPLDGRDALVAAACLVVAFLPHALLVLRRAGVAPPGRPASAA